MKVPGRKQTKEEAERAEELLEDSRAAQANFKAIDRLDVAYAVKELCRSMATPMGRDEEALKRLTRYLPERLRLAAQFAGGTAHARRS